MNNQKISIAIDGPAAAGKSTVAKIVAEKLGYVYVDTGAMYRAITYKVLQKEVDINEEITLKQLLSETSIELKPVNNGQIILLDGKDVTKEIREAEVTNSVSTIAASRFVREEMVLRQQQMGQDGGIVMDGRDIGTHVLPHAELKVFLLASVEIRAQRRHLENTQKGFESNFEKLKEEIALRDKQDTEREISPLRKASDAIEIDTSHLTINEVAENILALAIERMEEI